VEDRLILFDIDGTLVDTAGAGRRAMIHAFHDLFGVDGMETLAARVPFAGMTDAQIFESLAAVANVDRERFLATEERLHKTYLGALRAEMARFDPRRRTLPGVLRLLEALAERDHAFAGLLTGNLEGGARIKLQPFGLNPFFPGGGFGSDHAQRRQVARIAREELSRITGVEFGAAQVVVVGDTENDVDCARANGFRAVAVASGWGSRESLVQAGPEVLLDDLADTGRVFEAFGLA
jgi:phosphoglycolate phosphatase-like HAD superfamily hydrolase